MELENLKKELQTFADPKKANGVARFFKTKPGDYGAGDFFLGVNVPTQRSIAKKYPNLSYFELQELLNSKIHEHRLIALLILIHKYKKSKKNHLEKRKVFQFYLKNMDRVNNWDLVDLSAPYIAGDFLEKEGTEILKTMAKSESLWERRISIVSTLPLIKKRRFGETLAISDILIKDEHDLIHKAVGWMLREVGKKNKEVLELFLLPRYKEMPRTMLRYAIEKFPEEKRKKYLKGEV